MGLGETDDSAPEEADPTDLSADNLDFALDLDAADEADSPDLGAEETDDSLDFALGIDDSVLAEEPTAEAEEADDELDFALDVDSTDEPALEPSAPAEESDDSLDFALDVDDLDEEAETTELPAETAADVLDFALDFDTTDEVTPEVKEVGGDELDFALDFDKESATPGSGAVEVDAPGDGDALDFGLDLDTDSTEYPQAEDLDAESTQYMLRDAPGTADETSVEDAPDQQAPEIGLEEAGDTVFMIDEPAGDSDADDELDFALDSGDEITDPPNLEDTSFIMDDAVSARDLDDALDISLDLDDSAGGLADDLDIALDADGETTVSEGSGSGDMPTLDFDLDDSLETEPAPDFETVQLKAEDLARAGAIEPDATGTLDDDTGAVEVDSDFADIFGDDSEESSDEISEFDMELPDSALAAEEADVANVDELDFDIGTVDDNEPGPGDSDYERTQYMLRDIANITSDDDEDDEEDKTLVLGRSGGDVDEMQTKLDLAQAYIDMGDTEGARNILGEVMAEGSDAQQDLARELLSQLN